ncbi:MAG: sulfite exporter TauE/SafE family protein [Bacteriovoracia bacterium]
MFLLGAVAGLIDSMAGGGGLITLPTLAIALGPGALAIGTNKIPGTVGALTALWVYARRKHLSWRIGILFAGCVGAASFFGSLVTPHLPPRFFHWFLAASCPLILWIVFSRDVWIRSDLAHAPKTDVSRRAVAIAGLACGFYDGAWGPGGGTFMLLSLILWAKLPLLPALAASKLANSASAATSLAGYSWSENVAWREGLVIAAGVATGAYVGANYASEKAARVVRPTLAVLAVLLLIRVLMDSAR